MSSQSKTGTYKELTSVSNPIVKDICSLSQRKNRRETGRFMAEGLKLVADAIDADWPTGMLVFGKAVKDHDLVQRCAAKVKARGGMVLEVSQAVLAKIARRDNPQMVIGVFRQNWAKAEAIRPVDQALWVALEGVKDPGNLGTIIRTADAVGANGVILIGETTDPFALEATRATMGSIFNLPLVRFSEAAFEDWAKSWPGPIIGTHLAGAVDYRSVDYGGPTIVLMGNEQSGLPKGLADRCTNLVKIPQAGKADSLNLAVATGIMLYEVARGRFPV